jgi:hypothetical protein
VGVKPWLGVLGVKDGTTPLLTVTVPALESLGDCRLDEGS